MHRTKPVLSPPVGRLRYPCRMLNDLPPASGGRILPEPYEPWRIKPRHRHRRAPVRNRRWVAVTIAGAVIASGVVTAFELGRWSTVNARPAGAAAGAWAPQVAAPGPATPSPSTAPNHKTTEQHRFSRKATPRQRTTVPALRPPRTDSASRHRWTPNQPRTTPHQPRTIRTHRTSSHVIRHSGQPARSHRPRRKDRTPKWVGSECRRRFPHDSTRQGACNAALHNYFSR